MYLKFMRQMNNLLSKRRKWVIPPDEEKHDAFEKVAKFLEENDDEQKTVSDLIEKMEEYLRGTNCGAYGSNVYVKPNFVSILEIRS